jgi:hypothetical protein
MLDADNLKIENCGEKFSVTEVHDEDLSCLYVVSGPDPDSNEAIVCVAAASPKNTAQCQVIVDSDVDDSRPESEDLTVVGYPDSKSDCSESDQSQSAQRQSSAAVCQHCGDEFGTKRALTVHIAEAHSELLDDVFSCNACGKQFRTANGLKYHTESKHAEGQEERFECERPDCSYKTVSRALLRAHRYSHAINAPLTCPVCKKNFLGKFCCVFYCWGRLFIFRSLK